MKQRFLALFLAITVAIAAVGCSENNYSAILFDSSLNDLPEGGFPAEGGSYSINIIATSPWTVTSSNNSACKVKNVDNTKLTMTISENYSTVDRQFYLNLVTDDGEGSANLTLRQFGAEED